MTRLLLRGPTRPRTQLDESEPMGNTKDSKAAWRTWSIIGFLALGACVGADGRNRDQGERNDGLTPYGACIELTTGATVADSDGGQCSDGGDIFWDYDCDGFGSDRHALHRLRWNDERVDVAIVDAPFDAVRSSDIEGASFCHRYGDYGSGCGATSAPLRYDDGGSTVERTALVRSKDSPPNYFKVGVVSDSVIGVDFVSEHLDFSPPQPTLDPSISESVMMGRKVGLAMNKLCNSADGVTSVLCPTSSVHHLIAVDQTVVNVIPHSHWWDWVICLDFNPLSCDAGYDNGYVPQCLRSDGGLDDCNLGNREPNEDTLLFNFDDFDVDTVFEGDLEIPTVTRDGQDYFVNSCYYDTSSLFLSAAVGEVANDVLVLNEQEFSDKYFPNHSCTISIENEIALTQDKARYRSNWGKAEVAALKMFRRGREIVVLAILTDGAGEWLLPILKTSRWGVALATLLEGAAPVIGLGIAAKSLLDDYARFAKCDGDVCRFDVMTDLAMDTVLGVLAVGVAARAATAKAGAFLDDSQLPRIEEMAPAKRGYYRLVTNAALDQDFAQLGDHLDLPEVGEHLQAFTEVPGELLSNSDFWEAYDADLEAAVEEVNSGSTSKLEQLTEELEALSEEEPACSL